MWLEAVIHWLHLMAAVTWIGGMIFTAFVVQPVLRAALDDTTRITLYRDIGRRFKTIQIAALCVLLATGSYKLFGLRESPDIFYSPFGYVLATKLVLVLIVVILSYRHSYVWGPQLIEAAVRPGPAMGQLAKKLYFWGRINLALSLAVIFCAVLLRFNPFY